MLSPFIAASGVWLSPGGFGSGGFGSGADPVTWHDTRHPGIYDAMHHEADALASYVGAGRTESPVHPLDETVAIIATIDEARRQIGMRP